ncbi:helix-turn-helix domain-containing protein [Sinorhizobium meliloti]|uniref:helix-turn-helix domain-containing protein n=1 Tax=Rhizobium meliloti TaxID=382 RepID=UPI000FD7EC04|nr:helix-turn-helix transcriptional regulator [Sinorhizobium meliloti]RVI65327.1 XRE family transcriptional regulator [Sinorhizobium meliloti]
MKPENERNEIDVAVGRNIRHARERRGLSQRQLGEMIGVTHQQVQKYESAGDRISASRLAVTARFLGCSINKLFAGVHVGLKRTSGYSAEALAVAALFDRIPSAEKRASVVELVASLTSEEG